MKQKHAAFIELRYRGSVGRLKPPAQSLCEMSPSMDAIRFSDFISVTTILRSGSKHAAIVDLVDLLVENGQLPIEVADCVVQDVLKREELFSTCIGNGVAIPHTKQTCVEDVIGAVGICSDGIDFHSMDGQPIKIVFLIVAPFHRSQEHLRALDKISRALRDKTFRKSIVQSSSAEQVLRILEAADDNPVR